MKIFEMAGKTVEIAGAIATLDFLVLTTVWAQPFRILICIGEQSWSRCISIKDPKAEDPVIQLLHDEGRSLADMVSRPFEVEAELRLSEFMAGGYISVMQRLDADSHRNTRLAYD